MANGLLAVSARTPGHRVLSPLALLCLLLLLGGCRFAETRPDLFHISSYSPEHLDGGDQLEIVGTGFPEGRNGTVTFAGKVHRPGAEPEVRTVVASIARSSPNRLVVSFDETMQQAFAGDSCSSATFHGRMVVAFSSREAGAPPVTGTFSEVVLDLASPPIPKEIQQQREAEGDAVLAFLGLTLEDTRRHRELIVATVRPGSPAAATGLQPGDVLISSNGVRVHTPSDLLPPSGVRFVDLAFARGKLRHRVERPLQVEGFRPAAPTALGGAAMLIGLATGVMLLFMAPASRVLTWAARRVANRLKASVPTRLPSPRTVGSWLGQALRSLATEDFLPVGGQLLVLRLLPYLLFLTVSAAFTIMAFGLPLIAADLDLALLLVAALTALTTSMLMLAGWRGTDRWSLLRGSWQALALLLFQLPGLTALGGVAVLTGSLRAVDMVEDQGGWPWQWHLFASPALLVAFILLLITTVPDVSRASHELPELEIDGPRAARLDHPATRFLAFFAEWGYVFVLSGLAAIAFLGGWRLPGLDWAAQQQSLVYQVLGAILLQVKCWGLVGLIVCVRWALPRLRLEHVMGAYFRWLAPCSLITLGAAFAWARSQGSPLFESARSGVSLVTFALCLFVLASFARRVYANLGQTTVHLNVNPWL